MLQMLYSTVYYHIMFQCSCMEPLRGHVNGGKKWDRRKYYFDYFAFVHKTFAFSYKSIVFSQETLNYLAQHFVNKCKASWECKSIEIYIFIIWIIIFYHHQPCPFKGSILLLVFVTSLFCLCILLCIVMTYVCDYQGMWMRGAGSTF